MSITKIADMQEDKEKWVEARKSYLTSSDFYTWLGNTPKWWEDNRGSIMRIKRDEETKEFPPKVMVSVEHGSFDENNIMNKFGVEIGADVVPSNALTVNSRWPYLAASIDGFVHRPTREGAFKFSQDPDTMRELADELDQILQHDQPAICEIKKSTSAGWSKGKVSDWYIPQVQGQLYILEMDVAVIVSETVLKEGYRLYWNLTANIIKRDPSFEAVMDRIDKEFEAELDNPSE